MLESSPLRETPGRVPRTGNIAAAKLSVASATTSMAVSQREGSIAASTKPSEIRLPASDRRNIALVLYHRAGPYPRALGHVVFLDRALRAARCGLMAGTGPQSRKEHA